MWHEAFISPCTIEAGERQEMERQDKNTERHMEEADMKYIHHDYLTWRMFWKLSRQLPHYQASLPPVNPQKAFCMITDSHGHAALVNVQKRAAFKSPQTAANASRTLFRHRFSTIVTHPHVDIFYCLESFCEGNGASCLKELQMSSIQLPCDAPAVLQHLPAARAMPIHKSQEHHE